jgi:hypothetical protein
MGDALGSEEWPAFRKLQGPRAPNKMGVSGGSTYVGGKGTRPFGGTAGRPDHPLVDLGVEEIKAPHIGAFRSCSGMLPTALVGQEGGVRLASILQYALASIHARAGVCCMRQRERRCLPSAVMDSGSPLWHAARKAVPPHARPSPLAPRPCPRLLCLCVCWPGRRSCAWTVASAACPEGDPLSIAALIKAGCDTTTKVNNGQAGLMHAAASGNAAAVQVVLVLGNLQLEARDKDGDTAFLAACSTGDPECIAELIKAGG